MFCDNLCGHYVTISVNMLLFCKQNDEISSADEYECAGTGYMSIMYVFRAFYQSAQFINWPAQSRNYRLGAQFINRVRNLEIESRASNERSVHVLFIA